MARMRRVGRLARFASACSFLVVLAFLAGGDGATSGSRSDDAVLLFHPATPASAQNPAFLDGPRRLVFTLFRRGYNEGPAALCLLDVGKAAPLTLLSDSSADHVNAPGSSFHRQSGRLVFSSDQVDREEIWTVAPLSTREERRPRRVTRHVDRSSFIEPMFSPDGLWIVFERTDRGADDDRAGSAVWKVRRDGSRLARLWPVHSGDGDARQPNWSPDGLRILFQRRMRGSEEWSLWTMGASGGDPRRISPPGSSWTDATRSPDGRHVVASSDHGGLPACNLFALSASMDARQAPVRLTRSRACEDGAPSWSPDGEWIAFESHRASSGQGETPASLWRIRVPAPLRPGASALPRRPPAR